MKLNLDPLTLKFDAIGGLTDEELLRFASENDHIFVERNSEGNILIMSPASSQSSHQNARLVQLVMNWNDQYNRGEVYESSGGFILPDTAMRAPDVSFLLHETLAKLSPEAKEGFYKVCPDFLIELRSKSDQLSMLQTKMQEYIKNGCTLGWLIDTFEKKVYVYDKDKSVTVHEDFSKPLKGKYFMSDFELLPERILK